MGDVVDFVARQVAVGRRQAVGAVLARHAAEAEERVLEVLGECREALATEDDADVLPAAVGQDEVVEAVVERRAGDGDAELAGVGEVRERHAAGLGALAEDDVLGRALQRAPCAHPALERAADAVVGEAVGIEPLQVAQQRHRLHGGVVVEDRQQLALPDLGERIRHGAPAPRAFLGRQTAAGLDPARGALAEAGADGGGALAVMTTVVHVDSQLLVVDGSARHGGISVWSRRPRSTGPQRPAPLASNPVQGVAPVAPVSGRATPALRRQPPATKAVDTGHGGCR